MKKISILVAVLLISVFSVEAQLLWKVSGKGLKQDSYLFGTHHLISTSILDSIPGLFPAFNSTTAVVSEIVLNSFDSNQKIQEWATLPDSISMSSLLSPDDFEILDTELENALKIRLKFVDKLHPAMIQTLFQVYLFQKLEKIDDKPKSDSYFQIVANEKGIPVIGLETIDDQLQFLFPKDDLQTQAKELVEFVKRKDEAIIELTELNRLYKLGKINELLELNAASNKKWGVTSEENAKLLDNRNIDWVKKLPEIFNSGPCFVAVGALHLPGEKGIISLLKKVGYKVVPVENSPKKKARK